MWFLILCSWVSLVAINTGCLSDQGNETDDTDDTDTIPQTDESSCADIDTFNRDNCQPVEEDPLCIRYVDSRVPNSGDGRSWQTAFKTVQEGLDAGRCGVLGSTACERWQVWVARGTYYIHQGCRTDSRQRHT